MIDVRWMNGEGRDSNIDGMPIEDAEKQSALEAASG